MVCFIEKKKENTSGELEAVRRKAKKKKNQRLDRKRNLN